MTLLIDSSIPGEPQGKGRPRVTKTGHVYTPARTRKAEDVMATEMLAARQAKADPAADVAIHLHFHVRTLRRMDIDNFIKLALDAANAVLWVDDVQVAALAATIVRGSTNPRTEIRAWTMDR